jgi:pyruvate,water dikinase
MFIKTFKELSRKDIALARGKGASLGELTQAKTPVPPGFVVLVSALDKFLEDTDLIVEIASQIRDLFHDSIMPKVLEKEILKEFTKLKTRYVAVRSSATAEDSSIASWAGELETYLNTTKETLIKNIKKCWSSLFGTRALFYAFEKKLITIGHQNKIRAKTCKRLADCYPVSVAVVVQKMIQSEVSGICFTAHPVTKDKNQMVIEAGWGLGEAIVGGKITPDTYIIDKKEEKILDKNISNQKIMIVGDEIGTKEIKVPVLKQRKQKLSDKQIIFLAKICKRIENHYGKHQDIEWAMEKGKFYITQSRPITTL